jgi:hypothetical protein
MDTCLDGALVMFNTISINVVMRTDGLLQFVAHDHARALSGGATSKQHDTSTRIGERRLHQQVIKMVMQIP